MIDIKINNLKGLQTAFMLAPEKMKVNLGTAIRKSALNIERESKKITPVDTGRLRASIKTDIRPISATIAPHTNYAYSVHEGLGTNRGKGRRPYMEDGAKNSMDKIIEFFEEAIEKTLKSIK